MHERVYSAKKNNSEYTACGKMWIGADLNSDNLQISRVYLWISDHCTVTVRVGVRVRIRVWVTVRVAIVVYKLLEKVTKRGSVT